MSTDDDSSAASAVTEASYLLVPNDLYYKIFLQLSLKSVIRCKAVCRTWYTVISNPTFSELRRRNKCRLLCMDHTSPFSISWCPFYTPACVANFSFNNKVNNIVVKVDNYPYKCSIEELGIRGSCNGLFLVIARSYPRFNFWNPVTHELKEISNFNHLIYGNLITGVSYNSSIDTYTAVIGVISKQKLSLFLANSKLCNFNLIDYGEFPYITNENYIEVGVSVNGVPHWVMKEISSSEKRIVYFDISIDRFKDIPSLPDSICRKSNYYLVNLRDSLCAVVKFKGYVDVWTMNDHLGLKESWTKLFKIKIPDFAPWKYNSCMRILGSMNKDDGEVVFIRLQSKDDRIIVQKLKTGENSCVLVKQRSGLCMFAMYQENLASIGGMKQL